MKLYETVKLVIVDFFAKDVLTDSGLSGSGSGNSRTPGVYEGVSNLNSSSSDWF